MPRVVAQKLFLEYKNAAGFHPGPEAPSAGDPAPLIVLVTICHLLRLPSSGRVPMGLKQSFSLN